MAYNYRDLGLNFEAGRGGACSYVYLTTDALETVMASGYFNTDADKLNIGDKIEVRVVNTLDPETRTALSGVSTIYVGSNDLTTVTTSFNNSVAVTAGATALTVSGGSHNNKMMVLSNTAPIAITLPQATGSGARFRFFVAVAATATASKIQVANATDVMAGFQFTVTTTSTNVEGFATSATSDTYTFNGTTQGGIVGDVMDIEDVKTGVFSIRAFTSSTGTEATPFSAAVA